MKELENEGGDKKVGGCACFPPPSPNAGAAGERQQELRLCRTKAKGRVDLQERRSNIFPFSVYICLLINLEELGTYIHKPHRRSGIKMR